jgi:hypothetical protein
MLWINKQNRSQPELRTKSAYRGNVIENQIISKKTNLLITGNHHSGKTRAMSRLFEHAEDIWAEQIKPYAYTRGTVATNKPMLKPGETHENWECPQAVFICGNAPLSKWTDSKAIEKWHDENFTDELPYYTKLLKFGIIK